MVTVLLSDVTFGERKKELKNYAVQSGRSS